MTFTLTDTETRLGITLDQVKARACEALTTSDGEQVILSPDISPALAGAAARYRLGGPVDFQHLNFARMPVYSRH